MPISYCCMGGRVAERSGRRIERREGEDTPSAVGSVIGDCCHGSRGHEKGWKHAQSHCWRTTQRDHVPETKVNCTVGGTQYVNLTCGPSIVRPPGRDLSQLLDYRRKHTSLPTADLGEASIFSTTSRATRIMAFQPTHTSVISFYPHAPSGNGSFAAPPGTHRPA